MSDNMKSFSDYDLIAVIHRENGKQSREGKEAVSEIISRYMKLVLKRASNLSDNSSDLEDLTQEGLLALFNAINSFDYENGAKFSSFADVCVSNRIKNAAATIKKHKEKELAVIEAENDVAGEESSPESICLEKESDIRIKREIKDILAPLEVKVFELYMEGRSYHEIAESLKIPEKSVDNAVFRIRKKLKHLFGRK